MLSITFSRRSMIFHHSCAIVHPRNHIDARIGWQIGLRSQIDRQAAANCGGYLEKTRMAVRAGCRSAREKPLERALPAG